MERALKERIIGAIVLVTFAVLVVPVFLDGPAEEPATVRSAVSLPGQNQQDRTTRTIVLDQDRTEPVPAAGRAAVKSDEPVAEVVDQPPAMAAVKTSTPPAASAVRAEPESKSATGMWAVQLGSFSKQANAERLASDLRSQGYAAFLSQLKTSGGSLHRVRVGPQKDKESAETIAARLASAGHKGQVVPHP